MSVLDLQINVRRPHKDVRVYTLSCDTACLLTGQPTYTWYRNNQEVGDGQTLYLQEVTYGEAYTCRVSGSLVSPPAVCEFGDLLHLLPLLQGKLPLQKDEVRGVGDIC